VRSASEFAGRGYTLRYGSNPHSTATILRADRARVAAIFRLPPQTWLPQVDRATPLGTVYKRIARRAQSRRRRYSEARVEDAIEQLRAAASDAKAHLHVAAAAENTALGNLDAG
jgi:hypothetical protein